MPQRFIPPGVNVIFDHARNFPRCIGVHHPSMLGLRLAVVFAVGTGIAGAQDVDSELDRLLSAGRAAHMSGDHALARQSLEQASKLAEQTQAEPSKRYDILKQLSRVLASAQQYADAENYVLEAIHLKETALKAPPVELTDDFVELAMICRGLTDYERGVVVLERVMQTHIRTSGYDSMGVADIYSRMAQFHLDQKQPERAAGALTEALRLREKLLGAEHVGILPDLDRLATVRVMLRQYEAAELAYRRALMLRELALGPTDADLIATLDGLAYACFGQKKYDQAEPVYKRLLGIWENSVGADHPMIALTLDKMVTFYREQKRFEEAQTAAGRALAIRAHFLASGLVEEATDQLALHDQPAALALYRRALEHLDPARPEHDKLRQQIENNLKELTAEAPAPVRKSRPIRKKK